MNDLMLYSKMILHWLSVGLYIIAGANLIRTRKNIDWPHLFIFLSGVAIMSISLISVHHRVSERTVLWSFGHLLCGYAFYFISRNYKEKHFSFFSQMAGSYTKAQARVLNAFGNTGELHITKRSLDMLPMGKLFTMDDDKVQFEKKSDPMGNTYFETRMKSGGTFGLHLHDCTEVCIIDQGCLVCPSMIDKREFYKNESVTFEAGFGHAPYAKGFTRLRAYFYDNGKADR